MFILSLVFESGAENIIYRSAATDNMKIALTFDDGPHPYRTAEILQVLEKYNIKATFFVIGQNVDNYPDCFKKILSKGHEIGNHTYSHQSLKDCSCQSIEKEFKNFNTALSKYNCASPIIIRPPGGLLSSTLKDYADSNGYNIILWSIDTLDWAHTDAKEIANNVISNAKGGDIILMHDYVSDKSPTKEALEAFIPILIERGFEFVTVSELIKENAQ